MRSSIQGDEGAVIESVKAAGELKIPVSGTVTEVNDSLVDEPGQVTRTRSATAGFSGFRSGTPPNSTG